jgi:hypothetical protein
MDAVQATRLQGGAMCVSVTACLITVTSSLDITIAQNIISLLLSSSAHEISTDLVINASRDHNPNWMAS